MQIEEFIITMEVVGEFLGLDTDKRIWEYFSRGWKNWFPKMTLLDHSCKTSSKYRVCPHNFLSMRFDEKTLIFKRFTRSK